MSDSTGGITDLDDMDDIEMVMQQLQSEQEQEQAAQTGANNDLTVLNNSSLFDDLLDDIAPVAPFEENGVTFEKGYYLADEIYPQWSSFVKSFSVANSEKNALFKRKQKSARKDIERAFGVCWELNVYILSTVKTKVSTANTILVLLKVIQETAKRVSTASVKLVLNKVLVVKPHFKAPYELFRGRTPALSFMRPFGCHVTILNTLDHLGKFDGKSDERFFVGYSTNSDGPKWLFDIDALTESMNYVPVIAGTNSNDFARKGASSDAGQSSMETGPSQDYILMPLWNDGSLLDSSSKYSDGDNKDNDGPCKESEIDNQERPNAENNTKDVNTTGPSINTASSNINTASQTVNTVRQSDDFFGAHNDMRIWCTNKKDDSSTDEQGFISAIYEEKTHEDLHTCLFAYFLSQEEPKRITNALKDPAWVEAMQEELLQFHLQNVWTLVDLPRARIEAIRLFLAYAYFMEFLVYQMDVKSAFLYERIEEEVYVCQPSGFEDPDYLDKVNKVEKALYGLHQAQKACYETLTKYLLDNGFHKGKIDQTLFIKRQKEDILLI
nr:hypothetical protein [Tanacetum cinerariifolium]